MRHRAGSDAVRFMRHKEAKRLQTGRLRERAKPVSEDGPPPSGSYNLEEIEREAIGAALKRSGGVVAGAAKLLGIDRRTLQRKLKKLG